jgi:hypothetical protein
MKIKLLTSRAGPEFAHAAGEIVDVPADEAARLIAADQAVPFAATRAAEKAVKAKPRKETR